MNPFCVLVCGKKSNKQICNRALSSWELGYFCCGGDEASGNGPAGCSAAGGGGGDVRR